MSAVDERLVGARVHDSHDDDPDDARVVALPDKPAHEWDVDGEHSVATFPGNEDYPDDAPVVVIVFEDELAASGLDDWSGDDEIALSQLAEQGVDHFAFPAQRLAIVEVSA